MPTFFQTAAKIYPLKYSNGTICDCNGNTIIRINRDSETTLLLPSERDELAKEIVALYNKQHNPKLTSQFAIVYEEDEDGIATTEKQIFNNDQPAAIAYYNKVVSEGSKEVLFCAILKDHKSTK